MAVMALDARDRFGGLHGGLRLDLLQAFVVLADQLHFTRAARQLYISQSGLSRRIGQLEVIIGSPLVTRTTRSVEMTSAGAALLPYAEAILSSAEAAMTAARSQASAVAPGRSH